MAIRTQYEDDYYHILDVEQRLTDGEVEIDGKVLNRKQVKEFMFRHMAQIIGLGRQGWNPFDTIYLIKGNEPEDDVEDIEAWEKSKNQQF